jgi:hypothetical protein
MSTSTATRRHAAVVVEVGDLKEEIDEMIAPLIRELWIAGINTVLSCQEEYRETAWIEFGFVSDLEEFLNIVATYEVGGHTLYSRIAGCSCSHAAVKAWAYSLTPIDFGDDANENRPVEFGCTAHVYIPHQDIPILVERLAAHNRRQAAKGNLEAAGAAETESAGAI